MSKSRLALSLERLQALVDRLNHVVAEPPVVQPGAALDAEAHALFSSLLANRLSAFFTDWVNSQFANLRGDVTACVLRDRRADFVANSEILSDTLEISLNTAIAYHQGDHGASPDLILDALIGFRDAALEIVSSFRAPDRPFDPKALKGSTQPDPDRAIEAMLATLGPLHYQRLFVRMATEVTAFHSHLVYVLSLGTEEARTRAEENANTVRVRRHRDRNRRRVAAVLPVELYEEDLALLQRFGLLSLNKDVNTDLVGSALDAFLLYAFLTYENDPPRPWRERVANQKRRIKAITGYRPG